VNVAEILGAQSAAHPGRVALVDASSRRTLTYAELDAASGHVAAALRTRGLQPGETVLVLHPVALELYVAVIGMLRAGLVPAIPPPGAGRGALERCVRKHPPRGVLAGGIGWLAPASIPILRHSLLLTTAKAPFGYDIIHAKTRSSGATEPRDDGDPAMLTFTSGSTGEPKALVRSHGVARAQVEALGAALSLGEAASLCTMPIVLLAELAAGATCVLPAFDVRRPGRVDAARLAECLRAYDVARIVASPALLTRLVTELRSQDATLPGLMLIASGGAPVMPPLASALRTVAPNARMLSVYGSTEAEPIAVLDARDVTPSDHAAMRTGAGLLAGVPCAAGSLAIVAADGRALPSNAVGEVVVSGPHVVPHYLDPADDVETKIRAGSRIWHRTGDLGYRDAGGRLWLVGRAAAAIGDARGTVEPLRVECALSYLHGIVRAALTATDGARILVVEPAAGVRVDESAVRAALAFTPIDALIVARVPVDPRHNAKVDYAALRRLVRRHARAA
jgi:acyl-coenzyme A synthetase/AMP-(fatty) acid ligase